MAETFNTVPEVLHHWATHQPDTAAFIFVDSALKRRVLTRADVYRLAGRFAAILRRDGVRRGDVVCNTLPNSPERVVSDFGIMMAGATAMNGQIFLADGADFLGSLKDSQCTAVILDPLQPKGAAWLLESLEKEECSDGTIHVAQLPALCRILPCYWQSLGEVSSFLDMLEQHQDSYVAEVAAEDLACIWNTSGSTGFSKLVPHSHSHLLQMVSRYRKALWFSMVPEPFVDAKKAESATDQVQIATSIHDGSRKMEQICSDAKSTHQLLFRSFKEGTEAKRENKATSYAKLVYFNNGRLGWIGGFPADYLNAGVTRVATDLSRGSPADPAGHVWTVICQERCNISFLLPIYVQQILSREELWRDLPWKLTVLTISGQPVHTSLVKGAMGNLTEAINIVYASSEHGPMIKKTVFDPKQYEDCNNGKPLPGVEVKVINDEDNVVSMARGKMGQVIVRTTIPFQGYFNNEEATKKITLQDGWFRTGDVGYFTDSGDLCVICRTSFTIMRGAFLLHPGWLEARINTHPAVQSVLVVPVPDPVLHQELCACVVTKPEASVTAEELREFCRTLFLTDSGDHMTAVPPYFLFFSALPTNATGKPCRHTTSKTARQQLGL